MLKCALAMFIFPLLLVASITVEEYTRRIDNITYPNNIISDLTHWGKYRSELIKNKDMAKLEELEVKNAQYAEYYESEQRIIDQAEKEKKRDLAIKYLKNIDSTDLANQADLKKVIKALIDTGGK
jgi:hypothetical protein